METLDGEINQNGGVAITAQSRTFLLEASKWANFLAIVGFVMLGIGTISLLFLMGFSARLGTIGPGQIILSLAMLALCFFPTYYLFNFGKKIKTGINNSAQNDVDDSFMNLKSMFKFMGVMMIVVLSIYAIAFIITLVALM